MGGGKSEPNYKKGKDYTSTLPFVRRTGQSSELIHNSRVNFLSVLTIYIVPVDI